MSTNADSRTSVWQLVSAAICNFRAHIQPGRCRASCSYEVTGNRVCTPSHSAYSTTIYDAQHQGFVTIGPSWTRGLAIHPVGESPNSPCPRLAPCPFTLATHESRAGLENDIYLECRSRRAKPQAKNRPITSGDFRIAEWGYLDLQLFA